MNALKFPSIALICFFLMRMKQAHLEAVLHRQMLGCYIKTTFIIVPCQFFFFFYFILREQSETHATLDYLPAHGTRSATRSRFVMHTRTLFVFFLITNFLLINLFIRNLDNARKSTARLPARVLLFIVILVN